MTQWFYKSLAFPIKFLVGHQNLLMTLTKIAINAWVSCYLCKNDTLTDFYGFKLYDASLQRFLYLHIKPLKNLTGANVLTLKSGKLNSGRQNSQGDWRKWRI
jgi:hypothetical protein